MKKIECDECGEQRDEHVYLSFNTEPWFQVDYLDTRDALGPKLFCSPKCVADYYRKYCENQAKNQGR